MVLPHPGPPLEHPIALRGAGRGQDQDRAAARGPGQQPAVDGFGPRFELPGPQQAEREPAHAGPPSAAGRSSASSLAPSSAATSRTASMSSLSVRKFTTQARSTNRSPSTAFEKNTRPSSWTSVISRWFSWSRYASRPDASGPDSGRSGGTYRKQQIDRPTGTESSNPLRSCTRRPRYRASAA